MSVSVVQTAGPDMMIRVTISLTTTKEHSWKQR